ncbi:hypothetical protein Tco_0458652 [Tanacetum coccineum]
MRLSIRSWVTEWKRAATIASSLEAEQESGNINKTQSMATLNGSSPLVIGSVAAAELLTTVRHPLVLPVQVNAAEGGIDCLPTATIFEELERMGYEKPSQRLTFCKAFFSPQWKFLIHTNTPNHQCLIARDHCKSEFSKHNGHLRSYALATNQKFNLSKYIFDAMKKHLEGGEETEVPQDETHHDDSVPIPSNDPLLSGEDRMQLTKLILMKLKEVKKSKEMFDTDDLHSDEVIVDMAVREKQEQISKVDEREVSTGVEDSVAPTILVTTAGEGVTATKIDEITTTSAPTIAIDEINLAQTLIKIQAAKPKVGTTAATTTTTTIRPKARGVVGVVVQEPSEFRTTTSSP